MNMWEHHIQHLVRIAQHRKGQSNGILQAYLLWYVLYLDNQACLSGNGSGHFIRAFLTNDLLMPDWTRIFSGLDILRPSAGWHGEDTSAHLGVFTFSHEMSTQGAKLCQLQLKLRAEATAQTLHGHAGSSVLTACAQMVDQYQGELYASWHRYCPSYLFQPNSEYATGQLPAIARIFLDFVSSSCLPHTSKGLTRLTMFFFSSTGTTTIQRLGDLLKQLPLSDPTLPPEPLATLRNPSPQPQNSVHRRRRRRPTKLRSTPIGIPSIHRRLRESRFRNQSSSPCAIEGHGRHRHLKKCDQK
jgi:hypothetical protein